LRRTTQLGASAMVAIAMLVVAATPAAAEGRAPRRRDPIEGRLHIGRKEVASTNWSGYAAYGTTFNSVEGGWREPAAHCALKGRQFALAAFWVGLDGYENGTVEQIGTDADCEGSSEVQYAWFEFYPERLFLIEGPLKAGDQLYAEVTQTRLLLEDKTRHWRFEKAYSPKGLEFSSAEWIAEAPFNRLSNFGSVEFTGAYASDAGGKRSVEGWEPNLDSIKLVSSAGRFGTVLAEPVGLKGSSFSIVQP
jgi:Peptidase A4 family